MLLAYAFVEFLRRGLFSRLRQDRRDGEALGRQPDAGLLKRGLGGCLNHNQMILPDFPLPPAGRGQGGGFLSVTSI
jgi:hypothetical protein